MKMNGISRYTDKISKHGNKKSIFRLIENFIMVAYMSTVYDLYMSKMFAIQVLIVAAALATTTSQVEVCAV